MKNCLRCSKGFEPKNPKGKFCSDKCRVYWSREQKLTPNEKMSIAIQATQRTTPIVQKGDKELVEQIGNLIKSNPRIKQLEHELANPPSKFTSLLAKQTYFYDRRKELQSLKNDNSEQV